MFKIIGTGSSLPSLVVSNVDLEKIVDTSNEWILSKTGISERRILSTESLTDIAQEACEKALEDAKKTPADIDMVVCATLLGDTITPAAACLVAERLGIVAPAFDINAACTGFVYALDVVAGFFARGKVETVLVVGAEHVSRHTDWKDRASCVLFGDGAGAVVLTRGDNLLAISSKCTPNSKHLVQNFVSGESPFNKRQYGEEFLKMNGPQVYRFAVNAVCNDLTSILKEANLTEKDISHFVLHQANMRIIEAAVTQCGFPREKFHTTIERTGNISAASVPIVLDELNKSGKLKKGQLVAISAFGAGLTTSACVIRW